MIVAKHPAVVPLPVLMLIVPDVSDPLTEAEPPRPSTALLIVRLGDGPVKPMWFGTCRVALPLRMRLVTVICEAVSAPPNDAAPATFKSRKVVLPSIAAFEATCSVSIWVEPRVVSPEIFRLGACKLPPV